MFITELETHVYFVYKWIRILIHLYFVYNKVGILVYILMYILFINLSGKCDIFFFTQFNNNSNKKKIIQPMSLTWLNPTHVGWIGLGWVGLMWWVGLSWIFFYPPWWIGSKNPLNPTQPVPCTILVIACFFHQPIGQTGFLEEESIFLDNLFGSVWRIA